jgi:hypothetical protein
MEGDWQQATGLAPEQLSGSGMAQRLKNIRRERFSGELGAYQRWANRTNEGPYGVPMAPDTPIAEGLGSWAGWKEFGDTYGSLFKKAGVEAPVNRNPKALELQQFRMELADARFNPNLGPESRRQVREALKDMDAVLAKNSPEFATIQSNFARQMAREEALKAGRLIVRQGADADPIAVGRMLGEMPKHEQEWFRRGLAAEVLHKMGGVKANRAMTKQIFDGVKTGTDNASQILRIAFKNADELDTFVKKIDLEERMAETSQIAGNSRTFGRQALDQELGQREKMIPKLIRALGYTGPRGAALTGIALLANDRDPLFARQVAGKVANGLLDPKQADRTIQRARQGVLEENLENLWARQVMPSAQGLLGMLAGGAATR